MDESRIRSKTASFSFENGLVWTGLILQRAVRKCTTIYNARAQLLFRSSNLLFGDVLLAVAVVVS